MSEIRKIVTDSPEIEPRIEARTIGRASAVAAA
ncbi:hypothetical protein EV657_101133 [Rhodovulum visakhapatnamense]|uniref:Uncharacterized protein n=1 Tax=Rhodovulum visakhapatnamense TaxID=364297 RepID=A0A4R8G1R6_9RHOB|nr:hypothetical protein EV657_101133 [Rhodovulum visakhapatnamense]